MSEPLLSQNNKQLMKYGEQKNWKIVKLGDVVRSVQINEYEPDKAGLTRYVAGEHIESENLFVTKYGEISKAKGIIGSAFIRRFSKGQILYVTRRAYLRKSAIVTFDGICANTTLVLETNGKEMIPELLPFFLQSEKFVAYAIQCSVGSTNPYVRWRDLANFGFSLPSIEIQHQIGDILWAVEKDINDSENLFKKTIQLKEVLLNQLLIKGIGHTKFKEVRFGFNFLKGKIPEEWKIVELKELAVDGLKNGIFKKHEDFGSGVPLVNVSDLFSVGPVSSTVLGKVRVTSEELNEFSASNGDIFFCRSSLVKDGIGMTNIALDLREPAVFECHVIRLRPNKLVNPEFLFYYTRSQIARRFLLASAMNMTMTTIRQDDIEKLPMPLPTLEEQQKIVNLLNDLRDKISESNRHIEKLKQLRKNLSNHLLYQEYLQKDKQLVH